MSETLIKVDGASKKFCRSLKRSLWYGLQDLGREVTAQRHGSFHELRQDEFWALKDVAFELKRGECLGLLGRNGAGKTTLLRMLNGLIKPDAGRIEMRGRVGALIALGAGFNPILTGRENIYVNGSVLGLSKAEIESKIEEIVDFAEIEEFIDMPVQSYSSGMTVRLGFSIASTIQPDVLLLDEVLAVGDAAFRHKCYQRIHRIISNCAVIIVSHSMDQIAAVASKVGLMQRGELTLFSDPSAGINAYNEINRKTAMDHPADRVFSVRPPVTAAEVSLSSTHVRYRGRLEVSVDVTSTKPVDDLLISFTGVNENHQSVMNWNSRSLADSIDIKAGTSKLVFAIDPLLLHKGRYLWNLWISDGGIDPLVYAIHAGHFVVDSDQLPIGEIPYLPDPVGLRVTTVEGSKVFSDCVG
jgi:lipopolysaccharide transport system ATP-binding protein